MAFPSASPALDRALVARNYDEPTPVQAAVLEAVAHERDLLVSAQTGSGKTVAYGLAIASTLLGGAEMLPEATAPLALVVAPTRELALQVERELAWLWEGAGARIVSCVGGMDPRAERRKLAAGAHIVVGTPGRLRDHLERHGLDASQLRAVVLDEADEMLDLGFREDLEFILDATPVERRTLLFSATLPKAIVTLASRYQRDALRIAVAGGERGHADIEHRAIRVSAKEVESAVVNLLRFHESPATLVFANTREAVRHLQATLQERGFAVVALSGELGQHERNQALQALRDGRARVCVATDVAARGIDLPNLDLVIHAELPHDREVFQHRSGRTGRAGRKGVSCLLVPHPRRRRAERLLMDAGLKPEWSGPPTVEEIRDLDRLRFLADPIVTEPVDEEDHELARLLVAERSPEEIAGALARIWRMRLPPAEEVTDPGSDEGRRERRREFDPIAADRPSHGGHGGGGTGVWFRADVGRRQNADPKWVLPMLCRRGGIDRGDIGSIRIFDQETRFEVSAGAAATFWANARKPDDENIQIIPADGAPEGAPAPRRGPRGPRPEGAGESRGPRPAGGESRGPRPGGEKPARPPRRRDRG
ncbi:DEAD/DEAH box helicase [Siculibacillus lacustris]|uniref:DEAD/DEAH box helicase n=1 Tax=Siculibacillus lacustris TaxID=1549641 RepID=A0A4Q9VQ12_9HYPH|nr:DEAD/DEAH box helicase [Siculibacillus lacustris]TBW37600.1 DEAD/DEAH box helicase [Siculibacillus lacustris]